jgi:trehalose/maltose transport system substrate-binding protein
VKSFGGGQIVEPTAPSRSTTRRPCRLSRRRRLGRHDLARGRAGLCRKRSRAGVWQTGNAASCATGPTPTSGQQRGFGRRGKFDVAPCRWARARARPRPRRWAAGTWPCRSYGDNQEAAIDWRSTFAGEEAQKQRAINEGNLPTIQALYSDPDVLAAYPYFENWVGVFLNAVPRPSAPDAAELQRGVARCSSRRCTACISGEAEAAEALADLEADLEDVLE